MAARVKPRLTSFLWNSNTTAPLAVYAPDQKEIDNAAHTFLPTSHHILIGKDEKENAVIFQTGVELAKNKAMQGFIRDRLVDAFLHGDPEKWDRITGALRDLEEKPIAVEQVADEKDLEPGMEEDEQHPDVKEISDFFNNNKNALIRKLTPDVVKQPLDTLLAMHAWVKLTGDEFAGRVIQSFFKRYQSERNHHHTESEWRAICDWFRQNKEHRIQDLAKKVEEQDIEIILGIEGWTEIVGQPFAGHAIESYLNRYKHPLKPGSNTPALGYLATLWNKLASWLPVRRFEKTYEDEILQPGAPGHVSMHNLEQIQSERKSERDDRDLLISFIDRNWQKIFGVAALILLGCALQRFQSSSFQSTTTSSSTSSSTRSTTS